MVDYLAIAKRAQAEYWTQKERETDNTAAPAVEEHQVPVPKVIARPAPAGSGETPPCPSCGATPEELDLVRHKRTKDAALAAYEEHKQGCRECDPGKLRFCPGMETLRAAYFDAWQAYHGVTAGQWNVSEGVTAWKR